MRKTLVLGASLKSNRYSNLAVKRLRNHNIITEAFGLKEGNIGDVQIKTNLSDFQNIHTVTLYMNRSRQPDLYGGLLKLRPQRVIFNPGTENPEFYKLLEDNGIEVLVACTLVLLSTGQY
ncbi:CoA-binding protein [Flavobacteriaceae bacterium TP-CH-4]|uniref:CoA-binding protein n=1 Tax=Pelagihabitans pacificus TaxID=2696054 RepID=A0A967AUZ9_9FLAO|nr:CoA-binding protein [Pelagihabitans pacificus]NHF58077.1 CoA-binding protein [Pelagihabitans pacificus]